MPVWGPLEGYFGSVAGAQGPLKKKNLVRPYVSGLSLLAGESPSTERGRALIGCLMRDRLPTSHDASWYVTLAFYF